MREEINLKQMIKILRLKAHEVIWVESTIDLRNFQYYLYETVKVKMSAK